MRRTLPGWTQRCLFAYLTITGRGARSGPFVSETCKRNGWIIMVALFKALPFGIFLTIIVSLFMGSGGATGGTLAIRQVEVMEIEFYWSWYLFLGGTFLTWVILLMMGD